MHGLGQNTDSVTILQANAVALVAGQVASVVVWSITEKRNAGLYVTARIFGLISMSLIGLLSFLEHKRTIKPSDTLSYCLLTLLAADVIQVRTLWLKAGHQSVAIVATVNASFTLFLLVVESWSKNAWISVSYQSAPKEVTVGLFERAFFCWLNPLLRTGWRRAIKCSDLLGLDHKLEVETLASEPEPGFDEGDDG